MVAYNDPGFLAERHRVGSLAEVETIRTALAALATQATSVDD